MPRWNRRSLDADAFHAAWRARDGRTLGRLIVATPVGWTLIAFALTLVALIATLVIARTAEPVSLARDNRPQMLVFNQLTLPCQACDPSRVDREPTTTIATASFNAAGVMTGCTIDQSAGTAAQDAAACARIRQHYDEGRPGVAAALRTVQHHVTAYCCPAGRP